MRRSDPWDGIRPPPDGRDLGGLLVRESQPHEMFRARDPAGRRVLLLVHDPVAIKGQSLPKLSGIEVVSRRRIDDGRGVLALHLESEDHAEIFGRLCDDIVETVASCEKEATAVRAFIVRTWKWHELLKGSRRAVLSGEDQLGLIGELHTLLHILAPTIGLKAAVGAWQGSSGAPKDFELPSACVECKARGASARAKVRITSEHQLADVPGCTLALLVHTFANDDRGSAGAVDLHGMVEAIRNAMRPDAGHLLDRLNTKLDDAGYEAGHDYEVRVIHRASEAYRVDKGFPRIVPGAYPEGPVEVSYDLPLPSIAAFGISGAELKSLVGGEARR